MLVADVVKHFGSKIKVAQALGLVQSAPSKWGEHVPVNVALLVESLSDGKLVFDKEHYQNELLEKHKAKN